MKKTQKRTCNLCRAQKFWSRDFYCDLGFEVEQDLIHGYPVNCHPLEPCPKPLTYDEYFHVRRVLDQEKKRNEEADSI